MRNTGFKLWLPRNLWRVCKNWCFSTYSGVKCLLCIWVVNFCIIFRYKEAARNTKASVSPRVFDQRSLLFFLFSNKVLRSARHDAGRLLLSIHLLTNTFINIFMESSELIEIFNRFTAMFP